MKANKISIESLRNNLNTTVLKATYRAQKKYGFQIGTGEHATWNNEADAFKHAYMQWYLTFHFGKPIAKALGDYHEKETPNAPKTETNMDLWNNAIGREIAEEMAHLKNLDLLDNDSISDYAAKIIVDKMKQGELITNPDDKRQFKNMELERLKEKDRVFYKGELKSKDMNDEIWNTFLDQSLGDGLPSKEELDNRVKQGNLIYVDNYTRSDGTKVNGYYRRK